MIDKYWNHVRLIVCLAPLGSKAARLKSGLAKKRLNSDWKTARLSAVAPLGLKSARLNGFLGSGRSAVHGGQKKKANRGQKSFCVQLYTRRKWNWIVQLFLQLCAWRKKLGRLYLRASLRAEGEGTGGGRAALRTAEEEGNRELLRVFACGGRRN